MKLIIKIFVFIESTVIPLLFFGAIMRHIIFLVFHFHMFVSCLAKLVQDFHDIHVHIAIAAYLTTAALMLFHITVFAGLIIRRKTQKDPENFLEIIVPLLSTFFYLLFGFTQYSPQALKILLLPKGFFYVSILLGAFINMVGLCIATAAAYNLRYSFSVYAEVRDIVSQGLYRYVRHPIYFGYCLTMIGLLIMNARLDHLILTVCALLLSLYRARIEEKKLLLNSEVYREYAQRTPFIIPSLKRVY